MRIFRHTIQLAVLVAITTSLTASTEAAPICNPIDGHCYESNASLGSPNTTSWTTARDQSTAAGGHLVAITSADENTFLVENFLTEINAGAFIGLFQAAGSLADDAGWQWVTGDLLGFENWNDGEPNDGGNNIENGEEDFGHFFTSAGGAWNDLPGTAASALPFIVEYEPIENGDGRVPEPSTLTLIALGAVAGWGWRRHRKP